MSMFTLAISCLSASNFTLIHGPNIPGSYAILFFTASDFTFTTRHTHNWVLFLLCLSLFIPSGAVSLLFSSSILVTYQPWEFIFQCHIFFTFHTVHEVLKARMLKWFAIPFSMDHWSFIRTLIKLIKSFIRMLHQDLWSEPSVALQAMAHSFLELEKAVIHVIILVSFLWLRFSFCLPSDGWGFLSKARKNYVIFLKHILY